MTRVEDPTDETERRCFANGARYVAGVDEVGRGAWAGPVSVGVAVVDAVALANLPSGVRDSKMLSPKRREAIFPLLQQAVCAYAIGHATPEECDRLGMTKAQRLATSRAFSRLSVAPDALILDGVVNFSERSDALVIPGADRSVLAVAAASILAKVTRDHQMISYHDIYPEYGFSSNKGYPSPSHLDGLSRVGISPIHRRSWSFASRYVTPIT